jgi:hypothetical protein
MTSSVPWWFALASVAFMGLIAFVWVRWFGRLWRQHRDHPETRGDDWDPFS